MNPLYHPIERSERVIALARAVLAGFSLLAIWLDPTAPARHTGETYALLAAYLGYALGLLALTGLAARLPRRLGLATHAVDLLGFTVLLYLTEGPTSPLFVYFLFALLAAALRWGRRGVLWTAAAALAVFVGLGAYAQLALRDPAFELNRFVIRTVYLAVAAVLLGYLSAYEQRLREELAKLAAWPRYGAEGGGPVVEAALRHAAGILGAPRALMVWEEEDEPWRHLASWAEGEGFRASREASAGAATPPLVAEPLADADFLCPDARGPTPHVLHTSADGPPRRWRGTPLDPGLRDRFAVRAVLGLRLPAGSLDGRLFFLDKPGMTADDLVLGGIVARQVAADLDQSYLQQRLQGAALSEERARFARDLHDGVLQALTGLALQLKAAQALLKTDPEAARTRLADLQSLVAAEQRDLRFFVRQLKPIPLGRIDVNAGLAAYLRELAERTERQWGLRVELTVAPMARPIPEGLAHQVYRIVQEALANAVRHGHASLARVRLGLRGDGAVQLIVADNGRGFAAFRGRLDLPTLTLRQTGPRSIRERVAALDGDLAIDSTDSGARLDIVLPLAQGDKEPFPSDLPRPQPVTGEPGAPPPGTATT